MNSLNYLLEKKKMSILQFILLQINHPIWYYNAFFYLFVVLMVIFFIVSLSMMKLFRKKTAEMKLMQQQHTARIDIIRRDHSDTLERLRVEMLKREEDRTRQWMESEKETLHVLNGVATLLELGERLTGTENEKILEKIEEVNQKITSIEQLISNHEQKDR